MVKIGDKIIVSEVLDNYYIEFLKDSGRVSYINSVGFHAKLTKNGNVWFNFDNSQNNIEWRLITREEKLKRILK